jgi:hypothetical protein
MPLSKRFTADIFFVLQLILALVSGGSEFVQLLSTAQGVSVSWLASWLTFLVINLTLTIRAHISWPSRVTLQTVLTYAAWTTVIAADLGVMVWKGREMWDGKDTVTAAMVAGGVLLTLAYKIFTEGGAGMAGAMLLAGHIGIMTRLGQLCFAIREAGWDRNRQGAVLSETANEVTWILVTVAWLL